MPGDESLENVRLDRWLFSVRIFKSRSNANKAVAGGKVKVNGETAKPHKLIQIGDTIQFKHEGRLYEYKVLGLLERRVGAKEAEPCYEITEDADLTPEVRDMVRLYREVDRKNPKAKGRPSKRDRRQLERFMNEDGED